MTVNQAVFALAGILILVSIALSLLVSQYWLFLTGFVGLNMFQSAFTGICPAAMIFKALGLKSDCAAN